MPSGDRYDLDQLERGMGEEEANGLWEKEVKELLARERFRLIEIIPFVFGLNCLYVAKKDVVPPKIWTMI